MPDQDDHGATDRRSTSRRLVEHSVIAEPLQDIRQLVEMGLLTEHDTEDTPIDVVVELNLRNRHGVSRVREELLELVRELVKERGRREPTAVSDIYVRCHLSPRDVRLLVARDIRPSGVDRPQNERLIYRAWPDFLIEPLIYRSAATVKADAASRSFGAVGKDIVWAVVDSGIDASHPHFTAHKTLEGDVEKFHHDFTGGKAPLVDKFGHGTHVAGIIAGQLGKRYDGKFKLFEEVKADGGSEMDRAGRFEDRTGDVDPLAVAGIAPATRLVSLKVLDDNGKGASMNVVSALEYVRKELNGSSSKLPRVHGVNLSLGYPFMAEWFGCGQSPLCDEVNRLVRTGVVVVVAAGNAGYGMITTADGRQTRTGLSLTIMDPGNAELAITVGATHRDMPHTYGVSYFSSKGPTGDGRLKPDLVAPGERITSCAAGRRLDQIKDHVSTGLHALYTSESGTSMAAPHVSGAIAAFLSIRREFIGQPQDVKRVFMQSATSLGRERYFEGSGLVDLMRAIQSV
ncbi:MAG: S8 family peptidase [Chloroflexota bacterium]